MAKKKKQEKRESGIDISEEQYQRAVRRAGDPDVIQKLQNIYSSSEGRRTSKAAQSLAKQASKGFVGYGASRYRPGPKERRFSAVARKAISLIAPSGSVVKAITKTTKKKGSRGRGRPSGTYKVRYLPSGKAVKVPTHIYKKMLSAEKSQMRLAQAQQTAQVQMQADQVAMQTDARFQQGGAEDQFLAETDQQHEMNVLRAQQEMEIEQMPQEAVPRRPGVGQRIVRGVRSLGERGYGSEELRQPPQIHRPMIQSYQRPQQRGMELRSEPRVTAVSGKANLLNVSNNLNNQNNLEQSMLTSNKEINFFSNKQSIRRPDRSKSLKIMQSQNNR